MMMALYHYGLEMVNNVGLELLLLRVPLQDVELLLFISMLCFQVA